MAEAYVALLRGINVGGNNVIPMRALAATFEGLDLDGVRTYIQSGNVLFSTRARDLRALEKRLEGAVKKAHGCAPRIVVKSRPEMRALEKSLPASWKKPSPDRRYNVIFLRHAIDDEGVLQKLEPKPKPGIDEVAYRPGAILWSIRIAGATRSAMSRIVGSPIYEHITVRNLNTTRKLCALLEAFPAA